MDATIVFEGRAVVRLDEGTVIEHDAPALDEFGHEGCEVAYETAGESRHEDAAEVMRQQRVAGDDAGPETAALVAFQYRDHPIGGVIVDVIPEVVEDFAVDQNIRQPDSGKDEQDQIHHLYLQKQIPTLSASRVTAKLPYPSI